MSWKNERRWGSRYVVDWGEQDWVSWCFVCWSEGEPSLNAHPPLRRTYRVPHRAKTSPALIPDPDRFDARTTKCSMFPRIFELPGIQPENIICYTILISTIERLYHYMHCLILPLYASYQSYRRSNGNRLRPLYDRVHKMSNSKSHSNRLHL